MNRGDLLNCVVSHQKFGKGKVLGTTENLITILFDSGEKSFQYPEAFESHLICEDSATQAQLQALVSAKKAEKTARREQHIRETSDPIQTKAVRSAATKSKKRSHQKTNIAFKCNYCNGGQKKNGIGYIEACSDDMIKYNIEVAHHTWCSDYESPCCQYHSGEISREDLDLFAEDGGFVCYESQMLRDWTAYAGVGRTKDNREKPMRLPRAQINSLAILTTRTPEDEESGRFVFGVFLVDDVFQGDDEEGGYVRCSSSRYKLSLTEQEARKILFWNYYYNENAPDNVKWGQGLHRYLSDVQAASILRDILEVKRGAKDEKLAQEFFEHFCEINNIKADDMPVREGALQR